MPSATARELQAAARRLGFSRTRQTGSTIPLHGEHGIGPPLLFKILRQLGVTLEEFQQLQ